jgi:hypothetical protein
MTVDGEIFAAGEISIPSQPSPVTAFSPPLHIKQKLNSLADHSSKRSEKFALKNKP